MSHQTQPAIFALQRRANVTQTEAGILSSARLIHFHASRHTGMIRICLPTKVWTVRCGERQDRSRIIGRRPLKTERRRQEARRKADDAASSDDDEAFGEPLVRTSNLERLSRQPSVDLGGGDSDDDVEIGSPSFNNDCGDGLDLQSPSYDVVDNPSRAAFVKAQAAHSPQGRVAWSWSGKKTSGHYVHQHPDVWSYTTEEEYRAAKPDRQKVLDHVGRIIETDLGVKLSDDQRCSHCQAGNGSNGNECWMYSGEGARQVMYPGSICARCRWDTVKCSLSTRKSQPISVPPRSSPATLYPRPAAPSPST